jgi:5-methylthioadenosine/S-adenosylhomocysteine deaminase
MWAPHSPYATSDETLTLLSSDLAHRQLRVQLHVNEAEDESFRSRQEHGVTQVERLRRLGLLGEHLLAAHFVHPTPQEVELMVEAGAHVVHCPESNAKLASGLAAIPELLALGINVALGTDGAASNNNLDMIEEMRSAALLGKLQSKDAAALSAAEVLEMATMGGARAQGLEHEIGSLEIGKLADVACVDLRHESTWPVTEPVSQLIYGASGHQVTDTWVAGEAVYLDRQHQKLNRDDIFDRASERRARIEAARR